MIIVGGTPGDGVVTLLAGPAVGGDMRSRHARCNCPVVTAGAGTNDGGVVDPTDSIPTESGMTEFAAIGG